MTHPGGGHAAHGESAARGAVIPVLAVLIVIAAGIALAVTGHWRRGGAALAAAAALAAFVRLALPARFVGPLKVRSRAFDVIFLVATAAVLATAAIGTDFLTG